MHKLKQRMISVSSGSALGEVFGQASQGLLLRVPTQPRLLVTPPTAGRNPAQVEREVRERSSSCCFRVNRCFLGQGTGSAPRVSPHPSACCQEMWDTLPARLQGQQSRMSWARRDLQALDCQNSVLPGIGDNPSCIRRLGKRAGFSLLCPNHKSSIKESCLGWDSSGKIQRESGS